MLAQAAHLLPLQSSPRAMPATAQTQVPGRSKPSCVCVLEANGRFVATCMPMPDRVMVVAGFVTSMVRHESLAEHAGDGTHGRHVRLQGTCCQAAVAWGQVYTFGAPRPGDTNFARECNQLFPDMWHIINDAVRPASRRILLLLILFVVHTLMTCGCAIKQCMPQFQPGLQQAPAQGPPAKLGCRDAWVDPHIFSALQRAPQDAVPRVGKFGNLFRRPGQRVIVDYQGDIVVRPSPHEIQLRSGARIALRSSH